MKEINFQYNTSDEGLYIHLLTMFFLDEEVFDYDCRCYEYMYHIHNLNIYRMSYSTFHFILKTYSEYNN